MDNQTSPRRRSTRPMAGRNRVRRAFTLIEVLLVIVIIGMLATVLVFTVGGTQDQAAIDLIRLRKQEIKNVLYHVARKLNNAFGYRNEGIFLFKGYGIQ